MTFPRRAGSVQSLREQQRDLTRGLIMRALADIVSKGGVHSFTIQEVAAEAGVSHRTVYRHFPTREALLAELGEWLDEQLNKRGAPGAPMDANEMVQVVEFIYKLFDEYEPLVRALVIIYNSTSVRPQAREERTRAFERILREAAPNARQEDIRRLFQVSRALSSSQSWLFFRQHLGVDGVEAGQAVKWALQVLLDSVRTGQHQIPDGQEE